MNIDFKSILEKNKWNIVAVVIFFIVAAIFYYPSLQGYQLKQDDVKNFIGMSQEVKDFREATGEEPLWTNAMFSGMPSTQISVLYEGRFTTNFFSNLLRLWLPSPLGYLFVFFVSFFFMCRCFKIRPLVAIIGAIAFGLSTYFIVIIDVGHNTKALTMAYSPFLIGAFVLAFRKKTRWVGLSLSALFMAILFRMNHPQIIYYISFLLVAMGIVYLVDAIQQKKIKDFGFAVLGLVVAYVVGFFVNYGILLGTMEYTPYTIRGKTDLTINPNGTSNKDNETTGLDREYVTRWSYGVGETFTLLVPDFKGGASKVFASSQEEFQEIQTEFDEGFRPSLTSVANQYKLNQQQQSELYNNYVMQYAYSSNYYGEQPITSGPVYVGAIVLLLSVLALIYVKNPLKWAFFGVTLFVVMLSWGKNFPLMTNFFLDHFPLYNKFRAVTIILVVAELTIPLLGVLFLSKLIKEKEEIVNNIKPLYYTIGGFIFILLLMWIVPFTDFATSAELAQNAKINGQDPNIQGVLNTSTLELVKDKRAQIYTQSVWRSLAFILMGGALLIGYVRMNFRKEFLLIGLGALIFIDLAAYDMNFISYETEGDQAKWVQPYQKNYPYKELNADRQVYNTELQSNPELQSYIKTRLDSLHKVWNDEGLEPAEKQKMETWWKYRLLNRKTNFRVYEANNPYNSSRASYFHKSLGGYHGAKLGRYQDLISFHLAQGNFKVFDMLNTKYILNVNRQYEQNDQSRMQPTGSNLGNAWFIKNVEWVSTADEEIISLGAQYKVAVDNAEGIDIRLNGEPFVGGELTQNQNLETWKIKKDPKTQKMDTVKTPIRLNLSMGVGEKMIYANVGGGYNWQPFQKENAQQAEMVVAFVNADSIYMQANPNINFYKNGEQFEKGFVELNDNISKIELQGDDTNFVKINFDFPKQPGAQFAYMKTNAQRKWTTKGDASIQQVILEAEKTNDFDPENEVIINEKYKDKVSAEEYSGEGEITMTSYAPNHLKYKSNSEEKQFAVFSEIYYPLGWTAYIDGEKAPILQVNYTLRGLEIPAGEHEIEFKYQLDSYKTSTYFAYAGSILLIFILAGGFYMHFRQREKN